MENFAKALKLKDLGFDMETAMKMLDACGGDVDLAFCILINSGTSVANELDGVNEYGYYDYQDEGLRLTLAYAGASYCMDEDVDDEDEVGGDRYESLECGYLEFEETEEKIEKTEKLNEKQ